MTLVSKPCRKMEGRSKPWVGPLACFGLVRGGWRDKRTAAASSASRCYHCKKCAATCMGWLSRRIAHGDFASVSAPSHLTPAV